VSAQQQETKTEKTEARSFAYSAADPTRNLTRRAYFARVETNLTSVKNNNAHRARQQYYYSFIAVKANMSGVQREIPRSTIRPPSLTFPARLYCFFQTGHAVAQ